MESDRRRSEKVAVPVRRRSVLGRVVKVASRPAKRKPIWIDVISNCGDRYVKVHTTHIRNDPPLPFVWFTFLE